MTISSLSRLAAIGLVALGLGACTQASTAVDRVAGTNTSDRFPSQADGTRANPPGTAVERAIDRNLGTNLSDPADARAAQRNRR
jgi:hypothetical protein